MSAIEQIEMTIGRIRLPRVRIRNRDTCLACGRELRNPKSKARGMGPTCAKKWNHADDDTYEIFALSPGEKVQFTVATGKIMGKILKPFSIQSIRLAPIPTTFRVVIPTYEDRRLVGIETNDLTWAELEEKGFVERLAVNGGKTQ